MRSIGLALLAFVGAGAAWAGGGDGALVVKAYQVLTSAKHVVPTDARRVAEAAVAALGRKPAGFGADAAANLALLDAQARPASRAAVWTSIRAMIVAADDPHTFLFQPAFGPTLTALVEGRPAAAAGAAFARLADGRLAITEVQAGGPAAKAGLRAGDVIAQIDGHPPTNLSNIFMLFGRGPAIALAVARPGAAKPVAIRYEAFDWTPPNVDGRLLAGGVGYVHFRFFSAPAPAALRAKLEELSGARALIVDLRGNWGGIPDAIPSIFTDGEPLAILRDGTGKEEPLKRSGPAWPRPLPTVVLVDGGTYSAAEFMAFMLQDRHAARILGTPTGGGLTGVDDVELADGYVLHVANTVVVGPVSHTAPPGHRVTPDQALAERTPEELAAGVDRQLEAAVAALQR